LSGGACPAPFAVTRARGKPRSQAGELFRRVFRLDDDATHVVAALRANHMRRDGRTAFRAIMQLLGLLLIVSPTGAGTGITLTAFRYGHGSVTGTKVRLETKLSMVKLPMPGVKRGKTGRKAPSENAKSPGKAGGKFGEVPNALRRPSLGLSGINGVTARIPSPQRASLAISRRYSRRCSNRNTPFLFATT